jgi:hypothetical protein
MVKNAPGQPTSLRKCHNIRHFRMLFDRTMSTMCDWAAPGSNPQAHSSAPRLLGQADYLADVFTERPFHARPEMPFRSHTTAPLLTVSSQFNR